MSLQKLIDKMGQETMPNLMKNGSTSNWTRIKAAFNKKMSTKSTHPMNSNKLHVRNGTRGEGMGMSHQIQHSRS